MRLWGRSIGAVSVDGAVGLPAFQFTEAFARSGLEVAPVRMPLSPRPYRFPTLLREEAFGGLPGLLADSLPDRWGTTLTDAWLRAQGRGPESFDPVERLCYVGTRGMGALEFQPAVHRGPAAAEELKLDRLVTLAAEVLADREAFVAQLAADPTEEQMLQLLAIGTSAGGARAKAIIAYDSSSGAVRSGQLDAPAGFGQWLLKFDGVGGTGDHGLTDPQGWGALEYAYHEMAVAAGIEMTACRLFEEGGRRHFMTRRFDRPDGGGRLHMQTVAALEHIDYNIPGRYSYEQAMSLTRRLGLDASVREQLYRRMVFNVVARNQDDHVKNISFLMDRGGRWALSPAYDLTWSHQPGNRWLDAHQMTINGRQDGFAADDLFAVARVAGLARGRDRRVLAEVTEAVADWPTFAERVNVDERLREAAAGSHRLTLAHG